MRSRHLTLFDNIYISCIFLYANIFISPLMTLIPLPLSKIFMVIFFLFIVIHIGYDAKFQKIFVFLFLLVLSLSCITGIYYHTFAVVFRVAPFLFMLAVFAFFSEKYKEIFINISTKFIVLLIIATYIGFIYALIGGSPTLSFTFRGRPYYMYLTTLAPVNTVIGNYMRPSGIYDEPGALSFFICCICLLRILHRKNDNVTFILLVSGFITLSLIHTILFFFFILYYLSKYWKKKKTVYYVFYSLIVIISVFIIFYEPIYTALDTFLLYRFQFDSSKGTLKGDNRSATFNGAIKKLDLNSFFWGMGKAAFSTDVDDSNKFAEISDNPLSMLVRFGFFFSWYYYVFLLIILFAGCLQRQYFLIFLSICLLYLQRVYVFLFGYSFYFLLFFLYALSAIKTKLKTSYIKNLV